MKQIIIYSQIIVSVILIISILIQQRGSALSGTFGGENNIFFGRRGSEKWLFILTVIFSILFFGLALANLLI